MSLRLDHLVIAVEDLGRAIEDYRSLGFTVQPGGRHPGRTSHNALVAFEDGAYLEIIAWTEPGEAERWHDELARHGEGLVDFALVPADVPRAISQARARGLALAGPLDGGRVRPDGQELKWQTARQSTYDLPFLCGDVTPRDLRVPGGEARRHRNGALGIATLVVAVADLDASCARYAALMGREPARPVAMPGLGMRLATVALGETTLVLLAASGEPVMPASALIAEASDRLRSRGEGPCAFTLRAPRGQPPSILDPRRTHAVLADLAG